ncbi:MAG: hypothetical protein ACWIPJ_10480 [Polaribacter sp.]
MLVLIVLIICTSCFFQDYTGTDIEGLKSKNKYKKYLNKRIDPVIVGLDTAVIYRDINLIYDKEYNRNIIDSDSLSFTVDSYLKFYSNGTYNAFVKKGQSRELDKTSFNPIKGNIGFVISKKNKYFFMAYSVINGGSFKKHIFENKGDTLIVKYGDANGYGIWRCFVKKKVPEEWLNFEPDY